MNRIIKIATNAVAIGLIAGPALADPGHLAEVAGHGHWLAGVAIGAAIAIALAQGLRGRGAAQQGDDDTADAEPQEA